MYNRHHFMVHLSFKFRGQYSLIEFGTTNGSGLSRTKRFLGLMRKFKDSSQ